MAKRRKLPAPPLVINPIFCRRPDGSDRANALRDLARYLHERNLLTDGGVKSLEQGLRGRNLVVSLGLQDVRSYAHGLVLRLINQPPENWPRCTEDYFQTYDKGKPRRPTHLQRLYLQWSRDHSWPGLLQACRDHPHLWSELELALERLDDDSADKELLSLALRCRDSLQPWESAFADPQSDRANLLHLLRLLTPKNVAWRLKRLSLIADSSGGYEDWLFSLVTACHCDFQQARQLRNHAFAREPLERAGLACLDQKPLEPLFVSAFRSFVQSTETIEELFSAIAEDDRIRNVVYGARPGASWLEAQKAEMLRLIELP